MLIHYDLSQDLRSRRRRLDYPLSTSFPESANNGEVQIFYQKKHGQGYCMVVIEMVGCNDYFVVVKHVICIRHYCKDNCLLLVMYQKQAVIFAIVADANNSIFSTILYIQYLLLTYFSFHLEHI